MERPNDILQDWEKNYKARPITTRDWETHRGTFKRLYITENRDLTEVRRIMADNYGFFAKATQCKSAIKKWGLRKNLKKRKVTAMLRIQDKRALRGKKTEFKFNGQPVSEQNLERARKRHRGAGEQPGWEQLSPPVATPSDVDYWTPKPPNTPSHNSLSPGWGDTPYLDTPGGRSPGSKDESVRTTPLLNDMEELFGLHITVPTSEAPNISFYGGVEAFPEDWFSQKSGNSPNKQNGGVLNQSSGLSDASAVNDTFVKTSPTWRPISHTAKLSEPEIPGISWGVLCLECIIHGFTSHGVLSAELILNEAFNDSFPNVRRHVNTDWNAAYTCSCTSNICAGPFKDNHWGINQFSTSLFVEQINLV